MSELNQWIPVIGTLSGAILGFATSFCTAWWNARQNSSKAEADRYRKNLEDIYIVFIEIRRDYVGMIGSGLNKIHYDKTIKVPTHDEIPPIIKAEMLVKLYGKEILDLWDDFSKHKNHFGELYAQVFSGTFKCNSLEEKQKLSGDLVHRQHKIDKTIEAIHNEIAGIIKP